MRIQRKLIKRNKTRVPEVNKTSRFTPVNSIHNTSFDIPTKYANSRDFANRKMNIGLLVIATGKYTEFINGLLSCARKYFLPNHNVMFYIFTNDINTPIHGSKHDLNINFTPHREWPYPTLMRYNIFIQYKDLLLKEDYLFYSDVDMQFVDFVYEEILGERVATIHPGFFGGRGDPEGDSRSTSYVSPEEKVIYFAGGFNGGSSIEFIKMSETIDKNINKDLENNIIARWHDESHMNRYFLDNKPTVVLDPGYCYSTCSGHILPYKKKILALDKDHGFYRK